MFCHAAEGVSFLCYTQAKDEGEEGKPQIQQNSD